MEQAKKKAILLQVAKAIIEDGERIRREAAEDPGAPTDLTDVLDLAFESQLGDEYGKWSPTQNNHATGDLLVLLGESAAAHAARL